MSPMKSKNTLQKQRKTVSQVLITAPRSKPSNMAKITRGPVIERKDTPYPKDSTTTNAAETRGPDQYDAPASKSLKDLVPIYSVDDWIRRNPSISCSLWNRNRTRRLLKDPEKREMVWPLHVRETDDIVLRIWKEDKSNCHKLAPYAFSPAKHPYSDFRWVYDTPGVQSPALDHQQPTSTEPQQHVQPIPRESTPIETIENGTIARARSDRIPESITIKQEDSETEQGELNADINDQKKDATICQEPRMPPYLSFDALQRYPPGLLPHSRELLLQDYMIACHRVNFLRAQLDNVVLKPNRGDWNEYKDPNGSHSALPFAPTQQGPLHSSPGYQSSPFGMVAGFPQARFDPTTHTSVPYGYYGHPDFHHQAGQLPIHPVERHVHPHQNGSVAQAYGLTRRQHPANTHSTAAVSYGYADSDGSMTKSKNSNRKKRTSKDARPQESDVLTSDDAPSNRKSRSRKRRDMTASSESTSDERSSSDDDDEPVQRKVLAKPRNEGKRSKRQPVQDDSDSSVERPKKRKRKDREQSGISSSSSSSTPDDTLDQAPHERKSKKRKTDDAGALRDASSESEVMEKPSKSKGKQKETGAGKLKKIKPSKRVFEDEEEAEKADGKKSKKAKKRVFEDEEDGGNEEGVEGEEEEGKESGEEERRQKEEKKRLKKEKKQRQKSESAKSAVEDEVPEPKGGSTRKGKSSKRSPEHKEEGEDDGERKWTRSKMKRFSKFRVIQARRNAEAS